MTIFDVLSLIGGLALFLFGMQIMGNALEKKAGGSLKTVLGKMTESPLKGFLLGLGITAIIQSSSATTVMVVGFVNSGIMTLHQSVGVIMGANVGTTVTAWILSLVAIDGSGIMALFKPSSFVPVIAIIGVFLLMFKKNQKSKDTAMILLGFATLMTGMSEMSDAVEGLKDVPEFTNILTLFSNPVLGVLAGTVLTAIIQSSSASVGILQAISSTGAISFGTALPVIMGMSIGTCVTAMLSAIGANKNAKRATLVHLYFNIFGTVAALVLFYAANAIFKFDFLTNTMNEVQIAIMHSTFKVFCTLMWAPLIKVLEKLAVMTVKDTDEKEKYEFLDERLLATPAIAVARCKDVTEKMADIATESLKASVSLLEKGYNDDDADFIIKSEKKTDKYEDKLGTYLVQLSAKELRDSDSMEVSKLLHIIGDFERIADFAVGILRATDEMKEKNLAFSGSAAEEIKTMTVAVMEILTLARKTFAENDVESVLQTEALEQIVDDLKEKYLRHHIARLKAGKCTIEQGFVFKDILANLERVADHCANVASCVTEASNYEMDLHSFVKHLKREENGKYQQHYEDYQIKYGLIK